MTDARTLLGSPPAPGRAWLGGSLAQRAEAEELMDAEDLDPAIYAAVVRDLARVNVVTLAARPTLRFLARTARPGRRYRVLDVGFGDGDMLRYIARWGARRGIALDLTGVDLLSLIHI